jgi:hypothetical protein
MTSKDQMHSDFNDQNNVMLRFIKSYPDVIFIAPRPYGKHSARCFCTKRCSNEKLVKLYIDTVWINTLYLAGSFDAVAHPEQIHLLKQPVRYIWRNSGSLLPDIVSCLSNAY